jgi:hypothetical protein
MNAYLKNQPIRELYVCNSITKRTKGAVMISLTDHELSLAGHEFTWTSNQFLPDARRNTEYYNS